MGRLQCLGRSRLLLYFRRNETPSAHEGQAQWQEGAGEAPDATSGESRAHSISSDIEWYDLGDVLEAIEKKKGQDFKTCNIKAAQEQLREHKVTFYSQYMDPPEVVKALNIHVSKKRQGKNCKENTAIIRVISVPNALRLLLPQDTGIECEADMYLGMTKIFEKTLGIQMPYYGESGGVLYTRLLKALLAPKRQTLTGATLQRLLEEQQYKCSECDEKVTERSYDVHHKKRLSLCAGEDANNVENLTILCKCCHNRHTEAEQLALGSGPAPTIESQVSPRMKHLLDSTPRPQQVVWGRRTALRNMSSVRCMDINSCRWSAVTNRKENRGFPILSPLSDLVDFDFTEPLETYRFFEVMADDVPEHYPWRGNGLYTLEVVEYLLDKGVIAERNVTRALQHTIEIPMETFVDADQKIVDMVYNFGKEHFMRENDVRQIVKAMRLKFLGLAGRDTNKHWTVTESVCIDDAPEGKIHIVTREGQTQYIKQPTELVTNLTMKLINLQAVQGNDLALRIQTDLIEGFQKQGLVDIVGQRIDETYFVNKDLSGKVEQALTSTNFYPGGQPMFRVENKPVERVPGCPLSQKPRLKYQPPPKTTWQRFDELEIKKMNDKMQDFDPMPYEQRIARKFYNNGGGLLTGAAGTGKTTLSDKIVELIQESSPGTRIVRAALTHVAALLQKGQTIAHIMHKHLKETNAWFIFDEVSMIPSQLMGHIARWKMMGNKILLIGDFRGQFLPIFDRWGDSKGIDESNLMHSLCNGLHINLTVYRRGTDLALFQFYHDQLYYSDFVADLKRYVRLAQRLYPCTDHVPGVILTISHKNRETLNRIMNDKDVITRDSIVIPSPGPVLGTKCQPQEMKVYVGMSVYGCVRSFNGDIVNGVDYVIKEILSDKIVVDIDPQYNLTTPEDVQKCTTKLQPFVQAVADVLQTGPKTVEELIQARIKGIAKELTACFSRDKPYLRWLNFALLFPKNFEVSGNVVSLVGEDGEEDDIEAIDLNKIPKRIVLSHADFVCKLRMSYARCYYTVQGKTYRDTHVVLLDTSHKRFDMRKLIVGMSRATHGQFVHVATGIDEKRLLGLSKTSALPTQVDEPEDMMAGGSYCVDEEEDWDPSLY